MKEENFSSSPVLRDPKKEWCGTDGSIARQLMRLAIPIIFINLLQITYQMTDAFWVGRIGAEAVASVSVSFPITFLLVSLASGFSIAGTALVAQYAGARNFKMVNHVVSQTFILVVIASIILGIIGIAAAPSLLHLMNVEPNVSDNAILFLRAIFLGLPFMFGFAVFQSVMRGVGEVKVPMVIILGTTTLNFLLDPVLIFGWNGMIPAYGVSGAAMATFGTQTIAALIGFYLLLRGKYHIHLKLSDLAPDMPLMKKIFFLGLPASLEQSIRSLGILVMTFLVTSFGTITTAVYGVGTNLLQVVVIPALGISIASSVLAGHNIGAGKMKRAHDTAVLSAVVSFAFLSVVGIFCFIFASNMVSFFIPNDPEVIRQGTVFVRIMALSFGFLGVQMSLSGIFRASGNMMIPLLFSVVSLWVLQFPIAYMLSKHTSLGVLGIWWAFPISYILTAILTMAWFLRGDWKHKRLIEEKEITEVLVENTIR
ncbi:MAG: MATE family efflux transporter [Candidatus Paceibacterota bacterium]|jgi:putative MATE family efflux protein|nr:MATE family efflux transporter [Candidatus Paceibacterota bacterium]